MLFVPPLIGYYVADQYRAEFPPTHHELVYWIRYNRARLDMAARQAIDSPEYAEWIKHALISQPNASIFTYEGYIQAPYAAFHFRDVEITPERFSIFFGMSKPRQGIHHKKWLIFYPAGLPDSEQGQVDKLANAYDLAWPFFYAHDDRKSHTATMRPLGGNWYIRHELVIEDHWACPLIRFLPTIKYVFCLMSYTE